MGPLTLFAIFAGASAIAWLLHLLLYKTLRRLISRRDEYWRTLLRRTRGPTRLALIIIAVALAFNAAPVSDRDLAIIRHGLLVAFIICLLWVARTAIEIWISLHLRRFRLDVEDNLLARKHVTQFRILQRVANILIVMIAVAAILMTFEGVRQYGISLLASAGAAGIVVGLALQPVLRNLFAGIQLALTQPIRLDDAVIVEGEWGNIEEITATYVVIRVWDRRRLVVPLSYFIEQPFENWTREQASLLGPVVIYLDYAAPIATIRAKARQIVEESALWDRDVFALQVTDFRERVMEVRILASAVNAPRAFDLRCEIREKLASFLQDECARALPRTRGELEAADTRAYAMN
jgi:small-conductance mechanosensitive channel